MIYLNIKTDLIRWPRPLITSWRISARSIGLIVYRPSLCHLWSRATRMIHWSLSIMICVTMTMTRVRLTVVLTITMTLIRIWTTSRTVLNWWRVILLL